MKLSYFKLGVTVTGAIIAAVAIMTAGLVGGFFYVMIAGMEGSGTGTLESYASGEMRAFRSELEPRPQPTVVYTGADGQEIRLSDYRGKVILVNFWATWCAPCVEEMPALSNLQTELGGDTFEEPPPKTWSTISANNASARYVRIESTSRFSFYAGFSEIMVLAAP